MPRIMIEANLKYKVHWHNIFTQTYYISQAIGPSVIILDKDKPYYPNLKLDFGKYWKVYEKTRSNITRRRMGGISLRP